MKVRSLVLPLSSIRFDSSWTAFEVLQFLECVGQKYLTIVDGDKVLGIVTRDDIRWFIERLGIPRDHLRHVPISRLLEKRELLTCDADESVHGVSIKLDHLNVDYLTVKEGTKVIGLISREMILSVMAAEDLSVGMNVG